MKELPQKDPHRYEIKTPTTCTPGDAFNALQAPDTSAPGAPAAQEGFTPLINLPPLVPFDFAKGILPDYFTHPNPISQTVSTPTMTLTNTTVSGHVFYPGTVVTTVSPMGTGSVIDTVGTGNGANPNFNNFVGVLYFGLRNYLVQTGCDAMTGIPTGQ
jgi:hypothetical protein